MTEPREFTCQDCGVRVFYVNPPHANDVDICTECLWLRMIEDPVEREKLRQWLQARDKP